MPWLVRLLTRRCPLVLSHLSPALMAYEYLITLADERHLIWQRKWNGSTVLFLLNRYLAVIEVIIAVAPFNALVSPIVALSTFVSHKFRRKLQAFLLGPYLFFNSVA